MLIDWLVILDLEIKNRPALRTALDHFPIAPCLRAGDANRKRLRRFAFGIVAAAEKAAEAAFSHNHRFVAFGAFVIGCFGLSDFAFAITWRSEK